MKGTVAVVPYIDANRARILDDLARGDGDTLASLAHVLGCSDTQQLTESLRSRYPILVDEPREHFADSMLNMLQSDAKVAQSCQVLG